MGSGRNFFWSEVPGSGVYGEPERKGVDPEVKVVGAAVILVVVEWKRRVDGRGWMDRRTSDTGRRAHDLMRFSGMMVVGVQVCTGRWFENGL